VTLIRSSGLTADEIKISAEAQLDLGVGYPEFALPSWLGRIWYRESIEQLLDQYLGYTPGMTIPRGQSLPRQEELQAALLEEVCDFLEIDRSWANYAFVLYTGSHALERVIGACLVGKGGYALTTDPCIDIIPAMIAESGSGIIFAEAEEIDKCPSVERIVAQMSEVAP
jgi:hypothetical protein